MEPRYSKLAITSFIISLIPIVAVFSLSIGYPLFQDRVIDVLVFFWFFWFAIDAVSLISGFIALRDIRLKNLRGKNLALSGIVISVATVLIIAAVLGNLLAKGTPFA